jgi:multidrug resistance efflux pump
LSQDVVKLPWLIDLATHLELRASDNAMNANSHERVRAARPFTFREQAIDHYLKAANDNETRILNASPPWTWSLFWMLAFAVGLAVAIALVADVEITSRGRGALHAAGGIRLIEPQTNGVVVEVLRHSGEEVNAGDPLFRLESATVEAALLEADRKLALVRSRLAAVIDRLTELFDRRRELLRHRVQILLQRATSQEQSIARLKEKAHSYAVLQGEGIVGSVARNDAADEVSRAEREGLAFAEELSQVNIQMASLESELEESRWKWEQEVEDTQTRRNALAFSLDQMMIKAPETGYLESVLVHAGDVVQAGAALARLVSGGAPSRIVAFLPERDRASVSIGSDARVEVEQLPYAEYGTLGGHVDRLGSSLASTDEVREVLGDESRLEEPVYRVEMTLVDDVRSRALAPQLRSGMLVTARFTLRRRRLISLLIDPLRGWFR